VRSRRRRKRLGTDDLIVRRRITALAIAQVFKTISNEHLPFVRAEPLTGPWSHTDVPQVR
jgi:hypothetical protein